MELREVARVVRERWILAVCGLLLATGLAYLTYVSRTPSPYASTTMLFVTQRGYGFSNGVNGGQLVGNAYLYAQFAQSDRTRRAIGAEPNSIFAAVVTSGAFGSGIPSPVHSVEHEGKNRGWRRSARASRDACTSTLRRGRSGGTAHACVPARPDRDPQRADPG